jgi:hypothetical protein
MVKDDSGNGSGRGEETRLNEAASSQQSHSRKELNLDKDSSGRSLPSSPNMEVEDSSEESSKKNRLKMALGIVTIVAIIVSSVIFMTYEYLEKDGSWKVNETVVNLTCLSRNMMPEGYYYDFSTNKTYAKCTIEVKGE